MENNKTIKAGQTLTARSIGDWECIWTCQVLSRSKTMATVLIGGEMKRCKIKSHNGEEYVMAMGTYSMAPTFRAA